MSDDRLAEFWRATEAPGADLAFALALEERIARRRLQFDLAAAVAAALALIAPLAILWPTLSARADALVTSLDAAGPALAAVAVMGGALLWLSQREAEV
ncbi:MAG TPA: hypothetical protein VMT68_14015 [Caulobacteraceae bacterium]|nr:hypothetical protein [Caulobacteraceae bacterium]